MCWRVGEVRGDEGKDMGGVEKCVKVWGKQKEMRGSVRGNMGNPNTLFPALSSPTPFPRP